MIILLYTNADFKHVVRKRKCLSCSGESLILRAKKHSFIFQDLLLRILRSYFIFLFTIINIINSIVEKLFAATNITNNSSGGRPTSIPTYLHNRSELGKVLIVNNIKFINEKRNRNGAEKDSETLKDLFETIEFEVDSKIDLEAKDMIKEIEEFSQTDFSEHNISIVVMMSHGGNENGTQIVGVDNVAIPTENIIELSIENCHASLNGKPKIFISQCCRDSKVLCQDAIPMYIQKKKKGHSDILIAYSTLPAFTSFRYSGGWYIQKFCEFIGCHYKMYHLEEILKKINDDLVDPYDITQFVQKSTYENRGLTQCYLYKNS
ncbi:hypothetical protein ABEB36_013013 [Hypothenemus hampei]|uniref:Caspase-3 n=1 Tax=Hypothenemus hampei TaxID=57062 RepID=A0ABD1E6I6_HYPHA